MNLHGRPTVSGTLPEKQSSLGDLSTEPCGLVHQPSQAVTGLLGRSQASCFSVYSLVGRGRGEIIFLA